jgi:hypothetical protein
MPIDPVLVLIEELRSAEKSLHCATKLYERNRCREHGEAVNLLLANLKSLNSELHETMPTSTLGAAALLGLVTERLPFSHARYADHFMEVARRFGAGIRQHADLVWLRAMQATFVSHADGEPACRVGVLLHLAIFGAARPVMVFRAVTLAKPVTARASMAAWPPH